MPAWGDSSEVMLSTMRLQTPDSSGRWKDMEAVLDINQADYYIVQDYTDMNIPDMSKVCFFAREVPGAGRCDDIPAPKKFSWVNGTSYLYTKWIYPSTQLGGVDLSYDALVSQTPIEKKDSLLCIQSDKYFLDGHKKRVNFIKKFIWDYRDEIDLFGSIRVLLSYYGSGENHVNNKFEKLKDYRYCLAFDNGQYDNYFGSQFTDAILSWTVPIYWGSPNISDFFPEGSYIPFDASNLDEIHRVVDIIENDDYKKRLPALKQARDLILNKYNIWPTIYEGITTEKITWG